MLLVFVNRFYWDTVILIHPHIIYDCFITTMAADLKKCSRDLRVTKLKIFIS